VEADKTLIDYIKEIRPQDNVINAGVCVSEEVEADFYIFDIKGLNTFSKDEAEKRQESGTFKINDVVKVPLISINKIIKENFDSFPDFLSIDIEGLDLDVLKSLDLNHYPIPVICVETCMFSQNHIRPKDPAIAAFLISKGYEIYADTYINTIFVNKEWFYK
jgi:FkbM family methyltransferase